jgi:exopolysaccharide biosynthesis predicted pyruvyltransferase EpsI
MSPRRKREIKKLASENNLQLVQLANLEDFQRYDANPGEFIDYIANAELVCTDSFHAVIFSMQMKKPFLVYDREGKSSKMSSRLDTLLSKFKFEGRKSNLLTSKEKIFSIDYAGFDEMLDNERKRMNIYLTSII